MEPRIGDQLRDARFRSRLGLIEARVGNGAAAHYYVRWVDGKTSLVPRDAIHRNRLAITGYILIRRNY